MSLEPKLTVTWPRFDSDMPVILGVWM